MRSFCFFVLAAAGFLTTTHAKNTDTSFEESLQLRKIAEYWKEKDYPTAKLQIAAFLDKNPQSAFTDQLYAMLGDLYFQEGNFKEALLSYDKITGKEFRQKSLFHRLHCLYTVGKHEEFLHAVALFLKDPNATAQDLNTIRFELAETYFHLAHAPENQERKKELFKAALQEYQQLMHTVFSDRALLPQAQILSEFEEHAKAAALYALIAEKNPAKKEEYLFQAASLQLHKDRSGAIATFAAIVEMNGKFASKAAFNELNLLYQEKRYRDFILAQDKTLKHIPAEKLPLVQYYLGKSLYYMGDFNRAIDPLAQSLTAKTLDRAQEKSALLSLIACAKEAKDISLFEKTLSHLKAEFPSDTETADTVLMHAQLCRDKNEWSKARADIQELLHVFPNHAKKEALIYDRALLLAQEEQWQDAADAFDVFLQEFPQSVNRANALRHVLSCRMEDAKHASKETERVKKEKLLSTLNATLQNSKNFSSNEQQKIRYLLGKVYFELNQFDEAIAEFSEYAKDFPKDSTCADAYLLLAYAYQKGSRDEIHFTLNAEKALALNPSLQGAVDLHLTLFNTYLGLANKAHVHEKTELMEKAAEHLFLALDKPISKENELWLASYYFQQHQKEKNPLALERATKVMEKLLGVTPSSYSLTIDSNSVAVEAEVLKLAEIYATAGKFPQRIKLLEALSKEYQNHPDYAWKYQRMATFELGKAYLALDEREHALQTFEDLIASSSHISSYFAVAAQLEKAKLHYAMLKPSERVENGKAVSEICDTLKDVELKRKLHSEPIHLEAALCYAEIKSDLVPADQKKRQKRFLLEQIKESFSSPADPFVQEYLAAAEQFPDKKRLYTQYLTFIDAEIQHLEAEESHNAALLKEAQVTFEKLSKEPSHEAFKQRLVKKVL